MGQINAIRLGTTTHGVTGEFLDASNSYDGSYSTYWDIYYYEANGSGSSKNVTHVLTHTFAAAQNIRLLKWLLTAHAQTAAGASYNGAGCSVTLELYYGGSWHTIFSESSGTIQGNSSWNYSNNGVTVQDTTLYTGVTAIRFTSWNYVERRDEGAGGGSEQSYSYLYELEAFYNAGGYASII